MSSREERKQAILDEINKGKNISLYDIHKKLYGKFGISYGTLYSDCVRLEKEKSLVLYRNENMTFCKLPDYRSGSEKK